MRLVKNIFLEMKIFKLKNKLLEVVLENYGKYLTPLCFLQH
jgi:hypothetical protein